MIPDRHRRYKDDSGGHGAEGGRSPQGRQG
jgi:hypothetical protein